MSCFVVSNETIDAVVVAILGGTNSELSLAVNLGDHILPKIEINPEYEKIWPELRKMDSLEALGNRLLSHNVEAYEYSRCLDELKDLRLYEYKNNIRVKHNYTVMEMLVAIECYMYQIVDHEQETRHPIFRLFKELSSHLYREYVRSLPEWDRSGKMWS